MAAPEPLGNEDVERLADDFIPRVAEDLLGPLVEDQDPLIFVDAVRPLLNTPPFASLTQKHEFTMFGRTYAIGYEPDLKETLQERPRRTVLNPAWKWSVWYPLRRSGRFTQLPPEEQRVILAEHGTIVVEGCRIGLSETPADVSGTPPFLGQDTVEMLTGELGYDDERLGELFAVGALD